ncbi:uncharacterized protein LOC119993166 [Tripterygium wilfordii]|uniref:uncharacterized protein LOC119993166 n=1 Tax=Tripterygium wilfordii TaxID=458696 RepID=UPI0018F7E688|nr:uncharacterized protein LOC119993166 [Tripterygium wilfordii]
MVKTRACRSKAPSVSQEDDDEVQSESGDESSDSDNSVMNVRFDDSEDDDLDDDMFLRYTDVGVEGDEGVMGRNEEFMFVMPNDEAVFSDAEYASDSLDTVDGSTEEEGEAKDAHPVFKAVKHMDSFKWHLGIRFPSRDVFKDAVATYGIQGGWSLKWIKFDNIRARVGCAEGCKFLLFCSKLKGADTWELKTVYNEHVCERTSGKILLNSKWLANRLVDKMRRNPKMKLAEIMQKVRDKYTIDISKTLASRARKKALEVVHGSYAEQYKRLNGYVLNLDIVAF